MPIQGFPVKPRRLLEPTVRSMALSEKSKRTIALHGRFALAEKFPLLFAGKGLPKKPLKIGIFHDLRKACPEISYYQLRLALADYCAGPSYKACLIEGTARFDLAGQDSGEVISKPHAILAKAIFDALPEEIRNKWTTQGGCKSNRAA